MGIIFFRLNIGHVIPVSDVLHVLHDLAKITYVNLQGNMNGCNIDFFHDRCVLKIMTKGQKVTFNGTKLGLYISLVRQFPNTN